MELPIAIGQVVAQKYRVDRFIAQGGMGLVVAGFHVELDQPVAIKFLVSQSGLDSEGAERFRREARAAAKIRSEHVVRVFDIGLLDERVPYMVMELLHGNDLENEIERRRVLPVSEAVGYLLQAIDALAEAHSVGIVHRDLKPTNLFLAQRADGSRIVKVLDFGISKWLASGGQSEVALTRTAAFVGSPLYMSPEQMRSARDVDARADVWALGAILYVMVTGQLPHPGSSLPQVCLAVMNHTPRPVRDFVADAPEGLEPILMKCLAKDRAQRYASVAELAERLAPFAPECQPIVERASRLLRGTPLTGSNPPHVRSSSPASAASISSGSTISFAPTISSGSPIPNASIAAPPAHAQQTLPSATEAPWSQTGRKSSRPRRAPLMLATLIGLVSVLGLLAYVTRRKADVTGLALLPPPPASAVASAPLVPLVSDVHAAVPAAPLAPEVAPEIKPEVKPVPSGVVRLPPSSTAKAIVGAKANDRVPPQASAPVPSASPFTYFGGRR